MYVTVAEVLASFEAVVPEDAYPRVDALITDAELRVGELLGDPTFAWLQSEHQWDVLRSVVAEMVQRVLRSPGAYRSESDGSYSYSVDSTAAGSLMVLSEAQAVRLRRAAGVVTGGYGSLRLSVPPWSPRSAFL